MKSNKLKQIIAKELKSLKESKGLLLEKKVVPCCCSGKGCDFDRECCKQMRKICCSYANSNCCGNVRAPGDDSRIR